MDEEVIATMTKTLQDLAQDETIRGLIITGEGQSFCAGGDLNWMKRAASYTQAENEQDAMKLATMLALLNNFPRPTIARVNGLAYGGGVGVVACCDIVVAVAKARFCLSEVKLGLIPSVISSFVLAKIGEAAARRYFLTAEAFDAKQAQSIGLVHEVVENGDDLDAVITSLQQAILQGAPGAQKMGKEQIQVIKNKPIDYMILDYTSKMIAKARASDEGKEGIQAFLTKQKPSWCKT